MFSKFQIRSHRDFIDFNFCETWSRVSQQADFIVFRTNVCSIRETKHVNYDKNIQIVGILLSKHEEHLIYVKNTLFVKSGIFSRGWQPNDGHFTKFDGLSRQIWRGDFSFHIFVKCEIIPTIHTFLSQNNKIFRKSGKARKICPFWGKPTYSSTLKKWNICIFRHFSHLGPFPTR